MESSVWQSQPEQAVGGRPPQYAPASHVTVTFDLLTLKVVSESRVKWATSVPILVFLGLSVLDLGPMYTRQTDRQTDVKTQCPLGGDIISCITVNKAHASTNQQLTFCFSSIFMA